MELTRKQFDILSSLAVQKSDRSPEQGRKALTPGMSAEAAAELLAMGLLTNGQITGSGLEALEPYRVRRAVFLAAGIGSRMAPITLNTPKPLVRVYGVRLIDRLIDACIRAGIEEIYIVRGYLAEQFDQLLYKYPTLRFLESPLYNQANNIASALMARDLLANAYVFEADLLLRNAEIIQKYQYTSNFLAIKKDRTADWCFETENGIIVEEKTSGENCWQMVGISYWNEADGRRLSQDILDVYEEPGGKEHYWEQVPLVCRKDSYTVEVRPCFEADIVEIDTLQELKEIDQSYDV